MPILDANTDVLPEPGFLIGGEKITARNGTVHEHRYAATGNITNEVPLASAEDVDRAVKAARRAFPAWRRMSGDARRRLLTAYGTRVRELNDRLRDLQVAENGQPYMATEHNPSWLAELFEYNAGWADKVGGSVVNTSPGPAFDYTLDEPYGVVAVIVPWNGPFVSFGQWLAPALAAGNTIVIKPPELAPYTCLALAEIAEEIGFPPGVINVVPGGAEAGTALTTHPGVNKICFTGSGGTASRILAAASPTLTPTAFELGGKSARIVFDDVDVEEAAGHAILGVVGLSGQACIAGSRVLVQRGIYDAVLERAAAMVEGIPLGDPRLESTFMGPVINQGAVDRIMGFIDRAKSHPDGKLVTGGERVGGDLADGYFIQPTIFSGLPNDAEVSRDEIFGPVQVFMPFDTEEEAVAIANDTEYGLAAWVETNDLRRAHRLARDLDAGTVWINGFYDLPVAAPFGGNKRSGYGRQGGSYAIAEFTQPKNVWFPL